MKLLPSTGLEQLWVVNGIFNYLNYLSMLEKIHEKKQLSIALRSSEETVANQNFWKGSSSRNAKCALVHENLGPHSLLIETCPLFVVKNVTQFSCDSHS